MAGTAVSLAVCVLVAIGVVSRIARGEKVPPFWKVLFSLGVGIAASVLVVPENWSSGFGEVLRRWLVLTPFLFLIAVVVWLRLRLANIRQK